LFGFGWFGSEPSWHCTHTGIGGMRICRSVDASAMFWWHCTHCIDAPVRGSSLCLLCKKSWIFDGGRPAFLAVSWHEPHLFMVGSAILPFKPGPAWHWQQFGCDGIVMRSPPFFTVWHEVQSAPFDGFMWLRCENSAFLGVT